MMNIVKVIDVWSVMVVLVVVVGVTTVLQFGSTTTTTTTSSSLWIGSVHSFTVPSPIFTATRYNNPLRTSFLSTSTTIHSSSSSSSSSEIDTTTSSDKNNADIDGGIVSSKSKALAESILQRMEDESIQLGIQHAETYGLNENNEEDVEKNENDGPAVSTCAALYGLVHAISHSSSSTGEDVTMGLKGYPFVIRKHDLDERITRLSNGGSKVSPVLFDGYFTMKDLEFALEDDFLDAARGSTNRNKPWQITTVGQPTEGDSFEQARMDITDVNEALQLGTVIFNAAGAHIPKLAGPCLAVSDGTSTPNAVNLYITKSDMATSAPPHTDRQDVVVVQSTGCKHWKVFSPPADPSLKPNSDVFSRGKNNDALPLHTLRETSELLLETDLQPGDVLFIPAGFPHTTSTITTTSTTTTAMATEEEKEDDNNNSHIDTSLHLTFNIDTHVWGLNYHTARSLVLKRSNVRDILGTGTRSSSIMSGAGAGESNPAALTSYVGEVNKLPIDLHKELLTELPVGLFEDDGDNNIVTKITNQLKDVSKKVDAESFEQVPDGVWTEVVEQLRHHGSQLLDIHRDMYVAAIEEGRTRRAEDAMTAHLDSETKDGQRRRKTMTPERMQRLSVFRVKKYYEKVDEVMNELNNWASAGSTLSTLSNNSASSTTNSQQTGLPKDWAFTMPVAVGDQVEADLGGAYFPATVISVDTAGGQFGVQFFDGDRETLGRESIKLLQPPKMETNIDTVDTTGMTAKQIKRLKKQQKKQQQQQQRQKA